MSLSQALSDCAIKIDKIMETLLPKPEGIEAPLAEAMRYSSLGVGKKSDHLWLFSPRICLV